LLEFVKGLKGMVVLSGYETELYNDILIGWSISRKDALADGASKRIECLWINHLAAEHQNQ